MRVSIGKLAEKLGVSVLVNLFANIVLYFIICKFIWKNIFSIILFVNMFFYKKNTV
jgi:hypothetical protein